MTGYRQESTQLCRDAPELTAGPQEGKDGRMVWAGCWAAHVTYAFVLQAE